MAQGQLLAITADQAVRARMERVAAAAHVVVDIVADPPAIGSWLRAAVVLVDVALVPTLGDGRLPRREHIVAVAGGPMTGEMWRACVDLGAERVAAADDSDYLLVRILADWAEPDAAERPGSVIAVSGACGGAGASVFAAALAYAAARAERRSVLCDLDAAGPGLAVVIGMEAASGATWADISAEHGRLASEALRAALPPIPGCRDAARLLGFGAGSDGSTEIDARVVEPVVDAVRRAGDIAVLDVPRWPTPASDHAVARSDLAVLVTPAEVRGCYAAARIVPRWERLGAHVGLVVRGPSPSGVGAGDVAEALRLPLVATMRPQPGLARSIDDGGGLAARRGGPLARAADAVLAFLAVPA